MKTIKFPNIKQLLNEEKSHDMTLLEDHLKKTILSLGNGKALVDCDGYYWQTHESTHAGITVVSGVEIPEDLILAAAKYVIKGIGDILLFSGLVIDENRVANIRFKAAQRLLFGNDYDDVQRLVLDVDLRFRLDNPDSILICIINEEEEWADWDNRCWLDRRQLKKMARFMTRRKKTRN
jgi:hypothetical protein